MWLYSASFWFKYINFTQFCHKLQIQEKFAFHLQTISNRKVKETNFTKEITKQIILYFHINYPQTILSKISIANMHSNKTMHKAIRHELFTVMELKQMIQLVGVHFF